MGRRLDYSYTSNILVWNIGVTDVTKNTRLFGVTSTPCSTPLLVCVISTHRHPIHPAPVSTRHPKNKAL